MARLDLFSWFRPRKKEPAPVKMQTEQEVRQEVVALPTVGGGRKGTVTEPITIGFYNGSNRAMLARPMSEKDYDKLYDLSIDDHDISYAESNVVELSSGKYELIYNGASDSDIKKMEEERKKLVKKIYNGGDVALMNDLFRQLALFGAISAEAQPNGQLTGVEKVVLLSNKYVWIAYDNTTGEYEYYQQIVSPYWYNYSQPNTGGGYTKLNNTTYSYIPYKKWKEHIPYGVPPFFSALRATCIEDKMLDNFDAITKRLGLLGFISLVLPAPNRETDSNGVLESYEAYRERVQNYLEDADEEMKHGLANGYSIAASQYINGQWVKPEYNLTSTASNPQGAADLAELVIQMKSAGLKQDPSMLGKNFSTTESQINVILDKFTTQLMNYQTFVEQFMSKVFTLHFRLMGFVFDSIEVAIEPPTLKDENKVYEALNKKREHYRSLWVDGVITKEQYAKYMGIEVPANSDPPPEQQEQNNMQM